MKKIRISILMLVLLCLSLCVCSCNEDLLDDSKQGGNDLSDSNSYINTYAYPLELLRTVSSFSANPMTAVALIAEIGAEMSVFPTAKHLTSWAGYCPHNDQSGGKCKSTRISLADSYLKPFLVWLFSSMR